MLSSTVQRDPPSAGIRVSSPLTPEVYAVAAFFDLVHLARYVSLQICLKDDNQLDFPLQSAGSQCS